MKNCRECPKYKCNRMMVLGWDEKKAWDLCFLNSSNSIGTDKDGNRVFIIDKDIDSTKVRCILTERGEGTHEERIVTENGRVVEHTKKLYETIHVREAWNAGVACGFVPVKPRWQAIVVREGKSK